MSGNLRLAFLGTIEIFLDGVEVVGFRSKKTQALLCYLAVTRRPHSRSALAGLLWGDMPEDRARMNLSKSLTNLRRLVGHHLTITRQTIAFAQSSPYHLDVDRFETNLSNSAAEKNEIKTMQEAVELYRGEFHGRAPCRNGRCTAVARIQGGRQGPAEGTGAPPRAQGGAQSAPAKHDPDAPTASARDGSGGMPYI